MPSACDATHQPDQPGPFPGGRAYPAPEPLLDVRVAAGNTGRAVEEALPGVNGQLDRHAEHGRAVDMVPVTEPVSV